MLVDFILLGLLLGWWRGGRLSNLSHTRFSFLWLVFVGFGAKLFFLQTNLWGAPVWHLLSMGVVLLGALFNRKLYGMLWIAIGSLCNMVVMALNGGKMPVSVTLAQRLRLENLVRSLERGSYPEYVAIGVHSRFTFLADILPYFSLLFRRFFVVSVGDYLLGVGVLLFLLYSMQRKESIHG